MELFCQSERSGEDILKSRELLEQTETFQKVKRTICNSDVSTIMIDVVWGYGREHETLYCSGSTQGLIRTNPHIWMLEE